MLGVVSFLGWAVIGVSGIAALVFGFRECVYYSVEDKLIESNLLAQAIASQQKTIDALHKRTEELWERGAPDNLSNRVYLLEKRAELMEPKEEYHLTWGVERKKAKRKVCK